MSLISSKILLPGAGVAMGGDGSAYTAMQSQVFAAAGNFVLPAGDWWVAANADISVQISTDGGTTWVTFMTANDGGLVRSDGANLRIVASAATTAQYFGPA